jgi:hypothetical protein
MCVESVDDPQTEQCHIECGETDVNATVNSQSDEVTSLVIDPQIEFPILERQQYCSVSSPEMHVDVSQEILELIESTTDDNQVFAQQSHENIEKIPATKQDLPVKPLSELLFECLGQLRHCSGKIINLVTGATNGAVIHYESAFMEVKDTCKEVLALTQQAHDVAEMQLEAIADISDESFGTSDSEHETLVEHDPAKRPEKLTESQIKYLIHIGPCQPKLSVYTKNDDLAKKRKQCSFCPTWYKDYPYLEYSVAENKAFCYVCSLFARGLGREKAESAWIAGIDDWSKMKGSRGKDKMGKLETHFGSAAHASALQDYLHFVRDDNHVDKLLTREERERMVELEKERVENREVVEILIDVVLVLTRNGLALRGSESSGNYGDGNFCEIVNLIARHNPVMKPWLANRSGRKYRTTYMSLHSQNEFISLLGEEIQEIIREKVKKSGYCSVMANYRWRYDL